MKAGDGGNDGSGGTWRYSVPQAARLLGISERAVRKRIAAGTLTAERDGARWIILLDAEPSEPQAAEPRGTDGGPEAEPSEPGPEPIEAGYRLALTDQARRQLEALRDEWLQPLIEQIRELERTTGRLEAERDQLARERDALQAQLEALQATERHENQPPDLHAGYVYREPEPAKKPWWKLW